MVNKFEAIRPGRLFTFEELGIITRIRSLWREYMAWIRSYLVARVFNLPSLSAIQSRLYRVPLEFYNTLRVFYGERLAQVFLNYIQRRIIIEANLINAILSNNQEAANNYIQEFYANADEIAAFLGQSPYWEESTWKSLLYNDISMSVEGIRAYLSGEYEREIGIYETILANAAEIGTYMSAGIVGPR